MKTAGNRQCAVGNSRKTIFLFVFICQLLTANWQLSFGQSPTIKKSDEVETINTKKYYIHSVEKGQTLYSISKTYSTTVDIILDNNNEAILGLHPGDKLKIPHSDDQVTKEGVKSTIAPKEIKEKPNRPDKTKKGRKDSDRKKAIADSLAALNVSDSITVEAIKPIGDIHVALFLPLDLSTVKTQGIGKEDTRIGIEFYEGAKLAFDSLRKQGFPGYLHVYDSNQDSAGFAKLMSKPELKEMDLIIGPLYGKKFELVLKFAKQHKINIVSPTLLGNTMLLGNPNVSKVSPSYITQTEEIAKYISEKYAGQNIIAFNSTNPKDKPYLSTFKNTANAILQQSNTDTVKEVTFVTLKKFISKTKPNIIVIPSTNESFVTEVISKLYLHKQESKDSIIVVGLSNFQDIESLDFGYLKALNVIVSTHTFTDYTNPETKKFILKYRREFRTEPTQYVFAGFDAAYFYLDGLHKYGNSLQLKLPELKKKGIQTEFNFFKTNSDSGYENRGVGIMKFENYSYVRVK